MAPLTKETPDRDPWWEIALGDLPRISYGWPPRTCSCVCGFFGRIETAAGGRRLMPLRDGFTVSPAATR